MTPPETQTLFLEPQGKNRCSGESSYNLADIFRSYKKYYKDGKYIGVNQVIFNKIVRSYHEKIAAKIVDEGYQFYFPFKLGVLRIKGTKLKIRYDEQGNLITDSMCVNWGASQKLWKEKYGFSSPRDPRIKQTKNKPLVYFTNEHSSMMKYCFIWDKNNMFASENKKMYQFLTSPKLRKKLSDRIFAGKNIILKEKVKINEQQ